MLVASNLTKRFAGELIFERVSFTLNPRERVGLVGPNGSGKTTLLRIIAGILRPDQGAVRLAPSVRVGYLAQYPEDALSLTVAEALSLAQRDIETARHEMERSAASLADPSLSDEAQEAALQAYARAVERFEALGGYDAEHRREAVLSGLGLGDIPHDLPVAALSGGQKTRLALARLLLEEPDILPLDEPTNYLDLPALLWLQDWISASPQAAIIVSHDRRFLDATVSTIFALDQRTRTLAVYPGNYSAYVETRRREQEKQLAAYRDQQERIAAIEAEIRALKQRSGSMERRTTHFHYRKIAKGLARRAIVQERRLERSLKGEDRIERPVEEKGLYLRELTASAIHDRRLAVAARDVRIDVNGVSIVDGATLTVHGGERVALLGPNGSGKTTLLRALAGEIPTRGEIRYGEDIVPGYLAQEQPAERLGGNRTVLEVFRQAVPGTEAEARSMLDKFLFDADTVHRPVAHLSFGERMKLALALLVGGGATLLLLDEPTSHLDPISQERIEAALAAYTGPMIVVSHDRAFLEAIGVTRVFVMENGRLAEAGDLADAEQILRTSNHLDRGRSIL